MSEPYQQHAEIWLQPWCRDCDRTEDRTWCQDNVWKDEPCECGAQAVRYVLAAEHVRRKHKNQP